MAAFINALWEEGSINDIKNFLRSVNKEKGYPYSPEALEEFIDSKPSRIEMIYRLEVIWSWTHIE